MRRRALLAPAAAGAALGLPKGLFAQVGVPQLVQGSFTFSGTVVASATFSDLSSAARATMTVTGTTATSVAAAVIGTLTNSVATVGTTGHLIGGLFEAVDTTSGRITLYGVEGRVDGRTTDASATHSYVGGTMRGYYQGSALADAVYVVGCEGAVNITTDGSTPHAHGIAVGFLANTIVGGVAKAALLAVSDPILSQTERIGWSTGAGGTVTQGAGSGKATAVTLNKVTGQITLNNASLAADTTVSFTVTCAFVGAGDLVFIQHISAGTLGSYLVSAQSGAGTFTVQVRNITAGALAEAIVLQYAVFRGTTT